MSVVHTMSYSVFLIFSILNVQHFMLSKSSILKTFIGKQETIYCSSPSNSSGDGDVELWKDGVRIKQGNKTIVYALNPVLPEDGGTYTCKYLVLPETCDDVFHVEVTDLNRILNDQIPSIVNYNQKTNYLSDFKCDVAYNETFTSKLIKPNYLTKHATRSEVCVISHNGYNIAEKVVNFIPNNCDTSVFLKEFIPLKEKPFISIVTPTCMSKKNFKISIICDEDYFNLYSPDILMSVITEEFKDGAHTCRFILSDKFSKNDYLKTNFDVMKYQLIIQRVQRVEKDLLRLKWKSNIEMDSDIKCNFKISKNLKVIQEIPITMSDKYLIFKVNSNELLNGEITCISSKKFYKSNIAFFTLIKDEIEIFPINPHIVKISYNNVHLSWFTTKRDIGFKLTLKVSLCLIINEKINDDHCSHNLHEIFKTHDLIQSLVIDYLLPERTYKVNLMYKPNDGQYSKESEDLVFKTKASPNLIPSNIVVVNGHNFVRISWQNVVSLDLSDRIIIFHITTKSLFFNLHVEKNVSTYEIKTDKMPEILRITIQTSRFIQGEFILSHRHVVYLKGKNKLFTKDLIFSFIFVLLVILFFIGNLLYSCYKLVEESTCVTSDNKIESKKELL